jgi:hypothetical protein
MILNYNIGGGLVNYAWIDAHAVCDPHEQGPSALIHVTFKCRLRDSSQLPHDFS